ncbi:MULTISPECIES: hypothetical protein [unclassified Empedobacter]|uniref:hypothetical protein n=1 Tax=unclassified Empedobacter TaxID=2643773 RepID=UPI0025BF3ED0|nr:MULTISPECIES: hypothetical protein [unclassified Empedobacter]
MENRIKERTQKLLGLKSASTDEEVISAFFNHLIEFFEDSNKSNSNKTLSAAPILPTPYEMEQSKLKALESSNLKRFDDMTWDELDKGNHLATLKANSPNYFAKRFTQQFGKKPKNK